MKSLIHTYKQMTSLSKTALLGIIISSLGTFMFMPYISIYLSDLGYSTAFIGYVLLLFSFSQQGFTFFGGFLGDRFGTKMICMIGLVIRSLGYGLFIFSFNKPLIIFSTILVGFGGALITPSLKVVLAFGNESIRSAVFALRNTAVNFGGALGPLIGGMLYLLNIQIIFIFAAVSHLMVLIIMKKTMGVQLKEKTQASVSFTNVLNIFRDKQIVYLTFAVSLFYFLYMQFNLSIPLYTKDFLGQPEYVSLIFSFNGVLMIFLQYPIMVFFQNKFKEYQVLMLGMFFMALAFTSLTLANELYMLMIFTFLLTLGEILIPPMIDNIASLLAPQNLLGSYLGFVVFSFMIGGGLGSILGGYGYDWGVANGIHWLWFIYVSIAALGIALIWPMKKMTKQTNVGEVYENSTVHKSEN
ncbi:MFS transporter [Bacillus sp. WMMC1349]|uniref:MFS transporter n=1 Tax=Bacillus sp. WMMC1349 TaxID=2736254 RepID=UPI0015558D39|nr:MFS transporter [Bacillus sp. WMMC1349]NPC94204.1 MFS transporter [Bacillus sp. WMMC1349]